MHVGIFVTYKIFVYQFVKKEKNKNKTKSSLCFSGNGNVLCVQWAWRQHGSENDDGTILLSATEKRTINRRLFQFFPRLDLHFRPFWLSDWRHISHSLCMFLTEMLNHTHFLRITRSNRRTMPNAKWRIDSVHDIYTFAQKCSVIHWIGRITEHRSPKTIATLRQYIRFINFNLIKQNIAFECTFENETFDTVCSVYCQHQPNSIKSRRFGLVCVIVFSAPISFFFFITSSAGFLRDVCCSVCLFCNGRILFLPLSLSLSLSLWIAYIVPLLFQLEQSIWCFTARFNSLNWIYLSGHYGVSVFVVGVCLAREHALTENQTKRYTAHSHTHSHKFTKQQQFYGLLRKLNAQRVWRNEIFQRQLHAMPGIPRKDELWQCSSSLIRSSLSSHSSRF